MMREGSFTTTGPGEAVRLAYTEWGDRANPAVLLCVHGLTRNARDFDDIAAVLSRRYRVVCPDVAGRGDSQWLQDKKLYGYPTYIEHALQLVTHIGAPRIDWIGTSMGGIIGMMTAARPDSPIRRLVINDIGPFIPKAALERLAERVGRRPCFETLDAATDYVAEVVAGFGRLTRVQLTHLARYSYRPGADGRFELIYDPGAVAALLAGPAKDMSFWPVWDAITCPVLLLRGADTDLLPAETAAEMTTRGPKASLREVPDCGHAPALMDHSQIGLVDSWLGETAAA
jgi:pimeloyl-ACP methyl ester carboxylesterase